MRQTVFLAALLGAVGLAAAASEPANRIDAEPLGPEKLTFRIEVAIKSYVLYEPITIRCIVENRTAESIVTDALSNPHAPLLQMYITDTSGNTVKYAHGGNNCGGKAFTALEPGMKRVADVDLGWNYSTNTWAFPEAGKYSVQARNGVGFDEPLELESNSINVVVEAPSGIDAEAISSFKSKDEFLRLLRDGASGYCKGRPGPSCFGELSPFLQRFAGSAYAPAITRDLVETVLHTRSLDVTPEQLRMVYTLKNTLDSIRP